MAWSSWDSTYQSFQHTDSAQARTQGVPVRLDDTVVVPLHDAAAGEPCTVMYQTEEVEADKQTGSGIEPGQRVSVRIGGGTNGQVNPSAPSATNPTCGFAVEAAASAATKVKIRFQGWIGRTTVANS